MLDTIMDDFQKDRIKNDKTHTDLYTLENYCERYQPLVFIRLLQKVLDALFHKDQEKLDLIGD